MREYARISPRFWMGETGKKIRGAGIEAQITALYLLTSPHSNMIGLYWCPVTYISHETGISIEGASKALTRLSKIGFCDYDTASDVVWVYEMARYQIGDRLSEKDKQAKGVQNAYDEVPKNVFLQQFYDRYSVAFCMSQSRGIDGASKPLGSKEQEKATDKEQDKEQATSSMSPPPAAMATPHQKLLAIFHEECQYLPLVEVYSDKRKATMSARFKEVMLGEKWTAEQTLEWFRDFYRSVNESKFLTGRVPPNRDGRIFRADWEWIHAPTNFVKIVEGKYKG